MYKVDLEKVHKLDRAKLGPIIGGGERVLSCWSDEIDKGVKDK